MTDAERERRIYHHLYETCEGIAQQTERIVKLEELVLDMLDFLTRRCRDCDRWVQLSPIVGTCRDAECRHVREFSERAEELEVPL